MQPSQLEDPLACVRPAGCLQPYLREFAAGFISRGYSVLSTRDYVRSAAHLGRWMASRDSTIDLLTDGLVAEFARHRCDCPGTRRSLQRPSRRYLARVHPFVDYLRRLGVVPSAAVQTEQVLPAPLLGFRAWMTCHRGVVKTTVDRYERLIERMLPALGDDPSCYDAALVRRVFLGEVRHLSCVYTKTYITALRAFLRFHAAKGRCRPHLHRAVPTVPEWKLSALPRYLESDDVERVIASCDLSKPQGVRDRAILLLLSRLGLRAGDIVAMCLEDVDWVAGTVRVCGKGRREIRLPLPQDAGDALIEYLVQVRPAADTRRTFLCVNAPIRPFASSASVSDIVRFALKRADITDPPSKGAHLLRHSAATTLLRSGVNLDAIATLLRHKSSDTTAYYAKVDTTLLQQIVQPWPEDLPC